MVLHVMNARCSVEGSVDLVVQGIWLGKQRT